MSPGVRDGFVLRLELYLGDIPAGAPQDRGDGLDIGTYACPRAISSRTTRPCMEVLGCFSLDQPGKVSLVMQIDGR